ncbi:MAG: PDZ domain-containing protein [Acidobacteriota bacterium]
MLLKRSPALALLLALSTGPVAMAGEPCDFSCSPCVVEMVENLKERGWVGIQIDKNEKGTWAIAHVVPKSPAFRAGIQPGDVLVAVDGVPYKKGNWNKLEKAYAGMRPGRTVTYTVKRDGQRRAIGVELTAIPKRVMAQWLGQFLLENYHASKDAERGRGPGGDHAGHQGKGPGGKGHGGRGGGNGDRAGGGDGGPDRP